MPYTPHNTHTEQHISAVVLPVRNSQSVRNQATAGGGSGEGAARVRGETEAEVAIYRALILRGGQADQIREGGPSSWA